MNQVRGIISIEKLFSCFLSLSVQNSLTLGTFGQCPVVEDTTVDHI